MTNDQEAVEYINKNFITKGTMNASKLRWGFDETEEYQYIINRTSYLRDQCKFSERLYNIIHNLKERTMCACGKIVKFKSINTGYPKCCSARCSRKITAWKSCSATKKNLNIDRLNNFKSRLAAQDSIEIDHNDIIKFIDDILYKTDNGVKYRFLSEIHYTKYQNEILHIINITKSILPIGDIDKFCDFNISERFYIIKNSLTVVPKCPTCTGNRKYISIVDGYGKACSNYCRISELTNNAVEQINKQNFDILNDYSKNLKHNIFNLKCTKCDYIFDRQLTNARWKNIYCPGCYGNVGTSKEECEVLDYMKTLSNTVVQSYRIKGKSELDIFDPVINFGVEYNGIYWHSTNDVTAIKKFKNKHLFKTEWAIKNNIRLFQIFSDEWNDPVSRNIWKSMIAGRYNIHKKIFARKCTIEVLDVDKTNAFLNSNHLQGKDRSSIRLGLLYEGELKCVMTFCKSRYNKSYEWELSRFCSETYTSVTGGASRLLKFFIKNFNPKSIITYANRRYSNGELYENLNFTKLRITPPNYFYFKSGDILRSRNNFQKHLLKDKLSIFDESKTEIENMFDNKYNIIYDCGNICYGLDLKN
jgi:hypothetical protein